MNTNRARNARAAYPGKWLKADDLEGHQPVVTIEHVDYESVPQTDGHSEELPVATLRGKEKKLILNKTRVKSLTNIFKSDDFDDWEGQRVMLLAAPSSFGDGKDTIAIRAAPARMATPAPAPATEPADDDFGEFDEDANEF